MIITRQSLLYSDNVHILSNNAVAIASRASRVLLVAWDLIVDRSDCGKSVHVFEKVLVGLGGRWLGRFKGADEPEVVNSESLRLYSSAMD